MLSCIKLSFDMFRLAHTHGRSFVDGLCMMEEHASFFSS
jgi:hypothetical protein